MSTHVSFAWVLIVRALTGWPDERPNRRLLYPNTLMGKAAHSEMAHFNSFVRIPLLTLRQMVAPLPSADALATDALDRRVWPNHIDFNLHMNNASYLSAMDYGRVHLLAKAGALRFILNEHWVPVVGDVWITYRRSLPLWARYRLDTRLTAWDERWFYFEQTFTGDVGLIASAWVKGALRESSHGSTGAVTPQRVMDLVQPGMVSPALPEPLQILNGLARQKLRNAR